MQKYGKQRGNKVEFLNICRALLQEVWLCANRRGEASARRLHTFRVQVLNMSDHCCYHDHSGAAVDARYRRILWAALWINAAMFLAEVAGGVIAGSVSLLADAVDFAGDAANYGLSLAVLSMGLLWRARGALLKGCSMGVYGAFVLVMAGWNAHIGKVPESITMGAIALLALVANLAVAMMLYAFREGDANMRSVWLCTRNDAIGNLAVIFAAVGVFGTGDAWPDLIVAAVMGGLAVWSGQSVVRQALGEIRDAAPK
jgi:Co/Zn/Cd efflux system component